MDGTRGFRSRNNCFHVFPRNKCFLRTQPKRFYVVCFLGKNVFQVFLEHFKETWMFTNDSFYHYTGYFIKRVE